MKQYLRLVFSFILVSSLMFAGDVEEVKKQIISSSEYLSKNKRSVNEYSKSGGLEFWSSGGLMHEIDPNGRPVPSGSYLVVMKHAGFTASKKIIYLK